MRPIGRRTSTQETYFIEEEHSPNDPSVQFFTGKKRATKKELQAGIRLSHRRAKSNDSPGHLAADLAAKLEDVHQPNSHTVLVSTLVRPTLRPTVFFSILQYFGVKNII